MSEDLSHLLVKPEDSYKPNCPRNRDGVPMHLLRTEGGKRRDRVFRISLDLPREVRDSEIMNFIQDVVRAQLALLRNTSHKLGKIDPAKVNVRRRDAKSSP